MTGIVDFSADRAAVENTFVDDVVLLDPPGVVDDEGDTVGVPTAYASTRGTLTAVSGAARVVADRPGETIDATLSIGLDEAVEPGTLVDARGQRWTVKTVTTLRTRKRCELQATA